MSEAGEAFGEAARRAKAVESSQALLAARLEAWLAARASARGILAALAEEAAQLAPLVGIAAEALLRGAVEELGREAAQSLGKRLGGG